MQAGQMQLSEIIIEKIRNSGPIPFRDFMEMCLYYPECGYYTSGQEKFGTQGDYYTSPHLTPAFGAAIARQLEQMWHMSGKDMFTVVEYGAGTGMLCQDVLNYLEHNPALYERLQYCIIEKSPVMRKRQQQYLGKKVRWIDSMDKIGPVTGCVLSNELVDNFSVHRVVMQDALMEVFIDYENGFKEVLQPASAALCEYFRELGITLPRGLRTEVNLEAVAWIRSVAAALKSGFVLTIDYGYLSDELYCDSRQDGTLICYNKHRVNNEPYHNIGAQDITAHVNFSALQHWGAKHGLECCTFTDQASFLSGLGFNELLQEMEGQGQDIVFAARKVAFLMHTFLLDLGTKFKVLIQKKNQPASQPNGRGS
jgi:SAM-dependent MidA family methyltransferase